MEPRLPTLYQKRDQNFYFTYKGKQYYAGSTREAATQKLLEIVGTANADGPHSIKDAVKEYLASIEGIQSPDSVISKRRTYKRVAPSCGSCPSSRGALWRRSTRPAGR